MFYHDASEDFNRGFTNNQFQLAAPKLIDCPVSVFNGVGTTTLVPGYLDVQLFPSRQIPAIVSGIDACFEGDSKLPLSQYLLPATIEVKETSNKQTFTLLPFRRECADIFFKHRSGSHSLFLLADPSTINVTLSVRHCGWICIYFSLQSQTMTTGIL